MKILYIYRHPDMGFSIGKVFRPIENEIRKYAEVDSIYLPVSNYSLKGLWKNIRYAQNHCKKKKYDIVHITGAEHYLIPFLKSKKVVITVHDLGSITVHNPIKAFFKNILFVKTLRFADIVTCISDKTKNEVQNVTSNINKIVTICNPVGPEFEYRYKRFNESNPIVLHIGTNTNKNLENTIKSLVGIKCQLRIIGKLTTLQKQSLFYNKICYTNLQGLSDEEILKEYENCDLVNFPSLYEGFGMPIIEGQMTGRVVITSNISPMKEVAGGGAVLVNPFLVESIRNGYLKVINDKELRSRIIMVGKENVLNKVFATSYYSIFCE